MYGKVEKIHKFHYTLSIWQFYYIENILSIRVPRFLWQIIALETTLHKAKIKCSVDHLELKWIVFDCWLRVCGKRT